MSNGFASLGIREQLVQGLQETGVVDPTPIQTKAIPALLSGADVIAQAQTGTGKTLAFVLPMLERIDVEQDHVQGLILTPTRELAIQISSELSKLAPMVGAKVLAAYGGQDVERQLKKLQKSIHIVVGTPGRLLDHLRRGSVEFYKLNMLVLDEADQMLHMGFLKEVEEIIVQTSSNRQTLLFSATMPDQVRSLAKRFMREPAEIQIQAKQITLEGIEQILVQVSDREKQDALVQSIESYKPYLAMIFCRTKRRATELNEALQEMGYASDELHGDLSQAKREQVMKRFRDAKIEFLVATDVAARGLDVEGVTHVFNYDIPQDAESYIHRIGRTGRAGQTGVAVTFASKRDMYNLELIEKGIRMNLRRQGGGSPRPERSFDETFTEGTAGRRQGGSRSGERSGSKAGNARGGRAATRGGDASKQSRGTRGGNAGAAAQRGGRGGFAGAPAERGARGGNAGAAGQRGDRGGFAGAPAERGVRGSNAGAAGQRGDRGGFAGAPAERGVRGSNAGAAGQRGDRGGFASAPAERGARGGNAGAASQRGDRGGFAGAPAERGARGGNAGAASQRGGNFASASERLARGDNASEGRVRGGYSPYANERIERAKRESNAAPARGSRGGRPGSSNERGGAQKGTRGGAPRGGGRGKRP